MMPNLKVCWKLFLDRESFCFQLVCVNTGGATWVPLVTVTVTVVLCVIVPLVPVTVTV